MSEPGDQFDTGITGGPKTVLGPATPQTEVERGERPGVGFIVAAGTPTYFQNTRDLRPGETETPQGQATFNPDADPYDPVSGAYMEGHPTALQREADRYFGGDTAVAQRAWAAGQDAESEGFNASALKAWFDAGRPSYGLPNGASAAPHEPGNAWSGRPTRREVQDLAMIVRTKQHPFYIRYVVEDLASKPGFGEGWVPERPSPTSGADFDPMLPPEARGKHFIVVLHPQYRTYLYMENKAVKEISYTPAYNERRGELWNGQRIPAYPQVFGAPTAAKPTPTPPPPASTPAPPAPTPQPPTPAPEPPKPEVPQPYAADVMGIATRMRTWFTPAKRPKLYTEANRVAGELDRMQAALEAYWRGRA